MSIKISLTDYSEISNSKMGAADFTDIQVSVDLNNKISKKAKKHGVKNYSARFGDIVKKLSQIDLYNGNTASAQTNNEIKGSDENKSQQETEQRSEKRSEQPLAIRKIGRCRYGKYIKKKGAEIKPALIPLEHSKFTLSADNVPVEYQQDNDGTA